ncbi:crossover junction endodeoxyribonuclease RuvC [Acidipila sp. EB88]|uniref:crossover junction endodeoxyribonuclease RuvC n=1 Tax=Acidipila sp. EB88 TaxID=2305226 RepID=UPI000F602921|nr:crossover junction endodeoxyribonuclease RuvC [Acidipila sp. EB88]
MRVFGIDCGTEWTGYGVVEVEETARESRLRPICAGAIRLSKKDTLAARLERVHHELCTLIARHEPDAVAVEEVFHSVNAQSALKLGHVRGVALLAAASSRLPVFEYAPLKIKSTVVGYGLAKKEQVQFMVARLLCLAEVPEPADAADALAIAICHIHHAQTEAGMQAGGANAGRSGMTLPAVLVAAQPAAIRANLLTTKRATAARRAL